MVLPFNGKNHKHRPSRKMRISRRPPVDMAHGDVSAAREYPPAILTVTAYGPDYQTEETVDSLDQLQDYMAQYPVTWLQIQNLGHEDLLTQVGEVFHMHPLVVEEIAHPGQRPKAELYEEGTFVLMRTVKLQDNHLCLGQVCLWAGAGVLLSFEDEPSGLLQPLKDRLHYGRGRIRHLGTDYLAYAILDTVVESYFPVLEQLLNHLNTMEETVIHHYEESKLPEIHALKRDLLEMRQAVWPLREAVNNLLQEDETPITSPTKLFLRDCQDHLQQIMEMLEVCRELNSDLTALHLSHTANQQGEVMRVLTIISTIFMPLSFVAGIYGMNFNTKTGPLSMPELNWHFGYPLVLGIMGLFASAQMAFFWSKGWIGPRSHPFKPKDEAKRFRRTLFSGGRKVVDDKETLD